MSEPFIGEIRMFAGNFAPVGWAFCDGQLLAISEHETLFQLIGTTYGGDGESTFALPDLQSRLPLHIGGEEILGEKAGVESVALTAQQLPVHTHALQATTAAGSSSNPGGAIPADSQGALPYIEDPPSVSMAAAVQPAGGSQPHDNTQPFLCISFIIALFGLFPPRN